MKEDLIKFDLQLFAENSEGEDLANEQSEVVQEKTFTQSELDAILAKRLAKKDRENEELLKKAEQEKELTKLSADERAKKEFEIKQSELEEERKKIKIERLELQVIKILNEKNLPVEFSRFVIADSNEATLENINELSNLFNKGLESAVDARLKGGKPPKSGATQPTGEITLADYNRMGYKERVEFKNNHPDKFNELIK